MKRDWLGFLLIVFFVATLGFYQGLGYEIFSVKPNLAFTGVIAASFFAADILEGFLLILVAVLMLKFSPSPTSELLIFGGIAGFTVIIKNYLPWDNFWNNLLLIAFGTLFFYLFTAEQLIFSLLFVREILLNLFSGAILFFLLSLVYKSDKTI